MLIRQSEPDARPAYQVKLERYCRGPRFKEPFGNPLVWCSSPIPLPEAVALRAHMVHDIHVYCRDDILEARIYDERGEAF